MAKGYLSDAQVEREIARLEKSPHVKLAMHEEQLRQQRRAYMRELQTLERKGKQMEEEGLSLDMIELD
ncbi:MAG: hypothetical protein IKT52_15135 [Oscillospiraceae bacterium]|nr:hypothetical protein [Oscillospiraceae bacterium]